MREARDHVGNEHERVASPGPREAAVGLGLELVVELADEALADLGGHRLRVHGGSKELGGPHDQAHVLKVGAHRLGDARVLDLDRHTAPIVQARAIHLADRSGRESGLVELREDILERLVQLALDHLAHVLEGDPRRRVAQLRKLGLEPGMELGRQCPRVDERRDLADLHGGALHGPEHVQDVLGRLQLAAFRRGPAPLLGARQVGGLGRVHPGALRAHQASELGGAPQARGRDALGALVHPR